MGVYRITWNAVGTQLLIKIQPRQSENES